MGPLRGRRTAARAPHLPNDAALHALQHSHQSALDIQQWCQEDLK